MPSDPDAEVESCEGYKKLKEAVEADEKKSPGFHNYYAKLNWVLDRAFHYAHKTGLSATDILTAWENERNYWYMNFYQDSNQPKIEGDTVRVFNNPEDLKNSIGKTGFICPRCDGISKNPYACDTNIIVKKINNGKDGPCNWKVYGLFGDLGKGVYVFVKSEMRGERIFKPVAWESSALAALNAKENR